MDSINRDITYSKSNSRLLDKAFETKYIKKESKTPNQHLKAHLILKKHKYPTLQLLSHSLTTIFLVLLTISTLL